MSETEVNDVNEENGGYQIMVVNIKYGKVLSNKTKERPSMVTLDVPLAILKTRNSGNEQRFLEAVETFAYNTVTRKYGAEVNYCQVCLPTENNG